MTLKLIEAPEVEPVTADQVKFDAVIDGCGSDELIDILIPAARRQAEAETGRKLITQTWQLITKYFDCRVFEHGFQGAGAEASYIDLQTAPVISVSFVKYYDTANALQTLSTAYYSLNTTSGTAKLRLNYGYSWPSTYSREDAVTVEFAAGYGATPEAVPEEIRMWIRLHAAYEADKGKGQVTITDFIERILDPFRLYHV